MQPPETSDCSGPHPLPVVSSQAASGGRGQNLLPSSPEWPSSLPHSRPMCVPESNNGPAHVSLVLAASPSPLCHRSRTCRITSSPSRAATRRPSQCISIKGKRRMSTPPIASRWTISSRRPPSVLVSSTMRTSDATRGCCVSTTSMHAGRTGRPSPAKTFEPALLAHGSLSLQRDAMRFVRRCSDVIVQQRRWRVESRLQGH
jgi:hypothetical protein